MEENTGSIQALPEAADIAPAGMRAGSKRLGFPSFMSHRSHLALGAVIVATLTLVYTLLYWNRFLSTSAASTFFYAAELILRGKMPYRDFLFLGTPFHALKFALLIRLFGDKLIVPTLVAMFERVIVALLVYFWLTRFCRISAAAFATVFAMLVFSGDASDSLSSYHHDAVFWAVAAGLCASLWLDRGSRRVGYLLSLGSGVGAGLCFATKQTIGLGVLAAIPCLVALLELRRRNWRDALRFVVSYAAGWWIPNGLIALWLYRVGVLDTFVKSVFLTHNSKGSISAILSRPFNQFPGLFLEVTVGTIILAGLVWLLGKKQRPESPTTTMFLTVGLLTAFLLGTIASCTATMWPANLPLVDAVKKQDFPPLPLPSILMALWHWGTLLVPITGGVLLLLCLSLRMLKRPLTPRGEQMFLAAGISVAAAYMLSLSWQTYSPMALPGVALIVSIALERLELSFRPALCVVAVFFSFVSYYYVASKLNTPYRWLHWAEPRITLATHTSKLPKLAGFEISEPTLSDVERTTDLILTHSSPSDTLIVYPYFPIFYVLSDRLAPTFTFNHYLDVAPDEIAQMDARRLRANPPAVIVYMKEDLKDLEQDEKIFRMGQKSGSREIVAAIEDIAADYKELYRFKVPGSIRWIYVYSRN